ncbi:MAG: hypothetical protein NT003_01615 [Candidatus Magasanikbacteria bacterium]|nr:hypothetical protein [Candidatus Magasanikbacteria bacterium]
MNSIAKNAKQALSSIVVTATILWSMGASLLVGPLTASAAPADGTLIKAKEVEAVYYYKGGHRYTFPNQKTFKSWYQDFSTVQIIPLAELQTYPLQAPGGNVVYRAGTRLVKITTDPKVYAVAPNGKLQWVTSEAVAKSLYGANWSKRVDDVSDAFFTNYSIGADLTTSALPDGSLVLSGGSYYYISGGMKRAVSAASFSANNFNAAYALSVSDLSSYASGADLAAGEVSDVSQGGAASAPVAVSGALNIALASDSPFGTQSVVVDATNGGQKMAKMTKINFTANGGDAAVTQVKATRLGVSKDGDVDTLYLADANGKVLAKNTSFAAGVATFSGTLFTVPAGQTVSVWILEDVNKSAAAGSTQGWAVDASGVKTSGNGSVTGSATGGQFTVAVVTDLGYLEYATSSPISGSPTVDAGKLAYTVGTFKVKADNQEISLKKIKFTQIGSVGPSDLQNFKLKVAGVQLDGAKALLDGNTLTFDLTKDANGATNADNGLKLLAGQTKFLDIIGDVIGGTNRNFKFSVQNVEDVTAYDAGYKVNAPIVDWNTHAFAVETLTATTVNTGTLTVSVATDAPNSNVASSASSVVLSSFKLVAAGEDMKVSSLVVTSTSSDWTNIFKNVKLVLDGTTVGTAVTSLTAGTTATYTFSNNFVVKVGAPSTLQIIADLTDATITGGTNETISLGLVAGSSNVQGLTSLTTTGSTAISGNTLTVKSGNPTVVLNTSMVDATTTDATGVSRATNLKIGSFIVAAGPGEGSKITSIALADNTVALNGLYSRLRLQGADGSALAQEVGTLSGSGSTYTFNLTSPITVLKGQQYVVDVIADVLSTTSSSDLNTSPTAVLTVKQNGVTYQTLETSQTGTAPASAALTLQKNYIATKGTLTAAVSSDTPVAQQLVMGAVNQPVFKFKLTAGKQEDLNITELATAATIMASTTPTGIIKNIRLYDGDTMIGSPVASLASADASLTVATSTAYARFSALNLTVPKNTSKTYTIVADIASAPDTFSGENFTMHLINSYDLLATNSSAIVAKGTQSGQAVSASGPVTGFLSTSDLKSSVMTVYKTKITVAHAGNAPTGAASKGTAQTVAKFVVSNSANVNSQAATIKGMNLQISTSISQPQAGSTVNADIYKTEQTTTANKLTTSAVNSNTAPAVCALGSARVNSTCPLFDPTITFATLGSAVTIEAGASQTFTVQLDTFDAVANNTLTVGLGASDIVWSDGYTAGIRVVDSLPLTGKTLTF